MTWVFSNWVHCRAQRKPVNFCTKRLGAKSFLLLMLMPFSPNFSSLASSHSRACSTSFFEVNDLGLVIFSAIAFPSLHADDFSQRRSREAPPDAVSIEEFTGQTTPVLRAQSGHQRAASGSGGAFDWLGLGILTGVLSMPANSAPISGRA